MIIFHLLKVTVDGFEKRVVLHDFFTTNSFTHPSICSTCKKERQTLNTALPDTDQIQLLQTCFHSFQMPNLT
jgi:hypothetical protein